MSQIILNNTEQEIHKALNLLGLSISEIELDALSAGQQISLEHRDLSEIGSLFLLASAMAANKLGKPKKKISFGDLFNTNMQGNSDRGIPLYCWQNNPEEYSCIYLTVIDSKPRIYTNRFLAATA